MNKHMNLYIERMKRNIPQKDVAEKLKMSKTSYCNKENGHSDFTLRQAIELATFFNTTVDELFSK